VRRPVSVFVDKDMIEPAAEFRHRDRDNGPNTADFDPGDETCAGTK
jgi:hypothetical protein